MSGLSMRDMQDALMEAQSETMKILAEIQQEVLQDFIVDAVRRQWVALSPEMKEEIKASNPKAYDLIKNYLSE